MSPDGSSVIYVKEMGKPGVPDPYLYRASSSGGGQTAILKGTQQFLQSLALPRYSPDGRWIYFYGSPDRGWSPGASGRFSLYRVRPSYGARPEKLTDADLLPVIPHFEPS